MRMLLVLAMAAGCGSGDAAHDLASCGSGWLAFYNAHDLTAGCEAECESPPAGYGPDGSGGPTRPMCTVFDPTLNGGGGGSSGCEYFTFADGRKGCCFPTGTEVIFAECEAQ